MCAFDTECRFLRPERLQFRRMPNAQTVRSPERTLNFDGCRGVQNLSIRNTVMNINNAVLITMSFGDADVLVGATVIEKPAITIADQSFDEDDVRHLPDSLPFLLGLEDGRVGAC